MKLNAYAALFITGCLAVPALSQNEAEPAAVKNPIAAAETYAQIEPQALRLLSDVAEKYKRAKFYGGVVEISFGDVTGKDRQRFRLALEWLGNGVITRTVERGSERWATDGRKILGTATRRPQTYIEKPVFSPLPPQAAREAFMLNASFEGILAHLLTGQLGNFLLEPEFHSLTVEPTAEHGASQKIIMTMKSATKPEFGSLTLFVDKDLILRHAMSRETVRDLPEMQWDESYTETVIDREVPPAFYASLSLVPPKGYKRVLDFDPGPAATAPVPHAVPANEAGVKGDVAKPIKLKAAK